MDCGMAMDRKQARIQAVVVRFQGREAEACYLGYFECFNRQLYYEAHEVLEVLWLARRDGPDGCFYKGLIQLAGAFVHLQKNRPAPAMALFKLARTNLVNYPQTHQGLEIGAVLRLIAGWLDRLETRPDAKDLLALARKPELVFSAP
jgi:predicted metal-dependent hydrolase